MVDQVNRSDRLAWTARTANSGSRAASAPRRPGRGPLTAVPAAAGSGRAVSDCPAFLVGCGLPVSSRPQLRARRAASNSFRLGSGKAAWSIQLAADRPLTAPASDWISPIAGASWPNPPTRRAGPVASAVVPTPPGPGQALRKRYSPFTSAGCRLPIFLVKSGNGSSIAALLILRLGRVL